MTSSSMVYFYTTNKFHVSVSYHRPEATKDMKAAFILGLQTGKQFSQILPRFRADATNVAEEIFSSEKQMFLHAMFQ